jgi:hypothetical protein
MRPAVPAKPLGLRRLQLMREESPRDYANAIRAALSEWEGRVPLAAAELGIGQSTLHAWLKRDEKILGKVTRTSLKGRPAGETNGAGETPESPEKREGTHG